VSHTASELRKKPRASDLDGRSALGYKLTRQPAERSLDSRWSLGMTILVGSSRLCWRAKARPSVDFCARLEITSRRLVISRRS